MGPQNIHPHPPPLKNALCPEMGVWGGGGGGGVYNFFLDHPSRAGCFLKSTVPAFSKFSELAFLSASPKPYPSKPHPCNMPPAKTEVALQFSECCAAEVALQHWLFCSADVILTKSCAATMQHCKSCVAGKWRLPAAFLRILDAHV